MFIYVIFIKKTKKQKTKWRSDSAQPQHRARAQHAPSTRRPASAREHATSDPTPCTAQPPQHAQRDPAMHNTHHATKHSSTKHTACLTRLRRSIRPARPSRTSCAVAACAKSRVSVGAMRPQHPEITGKSASRPSKGPQHLLCPLSCHLPVTGDQQARPALPPERAARPNTRQSARKPRTDGAARPDPKRQLPLAEVHVAFTPHSDLWAGVNSCDACMHGHDSSSCYL